MSAASLSWSSSSWLQNCCLTKGTSNEAAKIAEKTSILTVVAQKKAKKIRKVILGLISFREIWGSSFMVFHALNLFGGFNI